MRNRPPFAKAAMPWRAGRPSPRVNRLRLSAGRYCRDNGRARPRRWRCRRPERRRRPRAPWPRSRRVMPPSTSRSMARPVAAMRSRTARILSSWPSMNAWPPKPGLTVMTSTRSRSPSTKSSASTGVAGIERQPGLLAERLDELDRAVDMRPGLGMHGDDVGAGLGEARDIRIDRRDHQMHVERQGRVRRAAPSRPPGRS